MCLDGNFREFFFEGGFWVFQRYYFVPVFCAAENSIFFYAQTRSLKILPLFRNAIAAPEHLTEGKAGGPYLIPIDAPVFGQNEFEILKREIVCGNNM